MDIFKNFSALFVEVWAKGILGVDIFQILIGLGIFLIFLLFRGFISKIIINRLKKIAKKTSNKLDDTFVKAMEGPARFFPIVVGFFIASYYLEFSSESQQFIDTLNRTLITILIFWLLHQLIVPFSFLSPKRYFFFGVGLKLIRSPQTMRTTSWEEVPGVGGLNPRATPGFRGVYPPPWNPVRGNHGARYPPPP